MSLEDLLRQQMQHSRAQRKQADAWHAALLASTGNWNDFDNFLRAGDTTTGDPNGTPESKPNMDGQGQKLPAVARETQAVDGIAGL